MSFSQGTRALFAVAVAAAVAGCHNTNELFCSGHPQDPSCFVAPPIDAPPDAIDAMVGCSSSAQCAAPTPVCDLPSRDCVQCSAAEPAACVGVTPVCGPASACEACQAHADCASGACLPDGSCGDDATVAYVDPAGTDNLTCTKLMPCTKVSAALATNRAYLKFHGTTDEAVLVNGGRKVTFLADADAKLTRSVGNGAIVTAQDSGTSLSIFDLSISNAPNNPSGVGLVIPPASGAPVLSLSRARVSNNPGGGISVGGGVVLVSQSVLSNNTGVAITASGGSVTVIRSSVAQNTGGGILVNSPGVFAIVGNTFFGNGTSGGTTGGITILTTQSATNKLEFNSFGKNLTQDGIGSAIQCTAGAFTARNNIMSGNGTQTNQEQVGGSCAHAYSIALPGTLPAGGTNLAQDPLFKNTTTGDLHILVGSPAIRAASPDSELSGFAAADIDGDPRVAPADVGADQLAR